MFICYDFMNIHSLEQYNTIYYNYNYLIIMYVVYYNHYYKKFNNVILLKIVFILYFVKKEIVHITILNSIKILEFIILKYDLKLFVKFWYKNRNPSLCWVLTKISNNYPNLQFCFLAFKKWFELHTHNYFTKYWYKFGMNKWRNSMKLTAKRKN